jgi:hypothetical protein
MSSTKYPCYGAVHIPGVPGTFANVIVEIDDDTREVLSQAPLPGIAVTPSEPDTSTQPTTPEAAPAPSDTPKKSK